ncbi:hypothetical protein [Streptomyces sp. TLI_171]|uniref:hypothetical protein n=1 Tax=Streptomyces sp. TLI_171 TaxID=1938859 RepID=UPI000C1A7EBD|nr:hypothetical protein [Streptomyces sp. TLI_171]RKE21704.1 hypothetical protein BX266_5103 [Streptomyces sp. TLI_171]
MALREHSRPASAGRSGRHGRPRPFGGRLRLPTIRFSGAAMAMSTVVGISLATTWLLNEQQQVGRRPGVTVGGPPAPSPDAPSGSPAQPAPTAEAARATADALAAGAPGAGASPTPSPSPSRPAAHPSAAAASAPPVRPAGHRPTASASATVSTSPSPSGTRAPLAAGPSPTGSPTGSPTRPDLVAAPPRTLSGQARVDALGRAGTRHTLEVRVDEAMTALQVEFRLNRPAALPGTVPGTDLPGAVATIALERDTLVYRFTTPPDLPLRPGSYTFTVTGAIGAPSDTAPESWTASAFALPTSRAVAARGGF